MAEFLVSKRQDLTLITVGGAIYAGLFDDRRAPHDVDFLSTNTDDEECKVLQEAARHVQDQCPRPLGVERFNLDKMLHFSNPVHQLVIQEAIA